MATTAEIAVLINNTEKYIHIILFFITYTSLKTINSYLVLKYKTYDKKCLITYQLDFGKVSYGMPIFTIYAIINIIIAVRHNILAVR